MLRQISSHIHGWSEIHGAARIEPYPWNSYLIDVPDEDVVVLVDPLPISSSDAQEIEQIRTPTHIFLTCEFHLRESESLRQRWGCEIWANEVELDRYETSLDGAFVHGGRLWDFIDPIYVSDVYYPETVLLVREVGGGLIVGDMLSGVGRTRASPTAIWESMHPSTLRIWRRRGIPSLYYWTTHIISSVSGMELQFSTSPKPS